MIYLLLHPIVPVHRKISKLYKIVYEVLMARMNIYGSNNMTNIVYEVFVAQINICNSNAVKYYR